MQDDLAKETAGFIEAMISADPSNFQSVTTNAFNQLGFGDVSLFHIGQRCGVLDPHRLHGPPLSEEWVSRYIQKSYLRCDVVMAMLMRVTEPFTWTEAETRFPSPKTHAYFRDIRKYVAPEMMLCPVSGPNGEVLSVALTMEKPAPVHRRERLLAHTLACLYAALSQRAEEPDEDWDPRDVHFLSKRELQCVYWVFRGKTDPEIACILEISSSTVHHHVEKAKAKLGAHSRVDLARIAAERGMIIEPMRL